MLVLLMAHTRTETWYLFRIPIADYTRQKWAIFLISNPFVSSACLLQVLMIQSLSCVLENWNWYVINGANSHTILIRRVMYTNLPTHDPTSVNILAVNVEENDQRQPIPYRIPPGY